MQIAITGASGFIGMELARTFEHIVPILRHDDETTILEKLEGVDVVINLAGAPIIKRWSEPYKQTLIDSRIETTKHLVKAINQSSVSHFISTSAIGYYPDDLHCDERCKEPGSDFLANLAYRWEHEAHQCNKPTAILRFGVVLGKNGGALKQMLTPFSLGVGGTIGFGRMMTSWIDIEDLMRIYRFVIEKKLAGTFNAVSPNPISNYTLTKTLGKVLHRPTVLPIPEFVLKLMYGEAAAVLTSSKIIYPKTLIDAGFTFAYDDIEASLEHLIRMKE